MDTDAVVYFTMILAIVFFWPYFYCHFATMASDRMSNIGNVVYDSNWYEFPLELQKNCILIMVQAQQNVYITGFELIRCTLLSYQRVLYEIGAVIQQTVQSFFSFYRSVVDDQIIGLILLGT